MESGGRLLTSETGVLFCGSLNMTCDLVPEIFDVLSEGIIIWDANGMLQLCSTAAAGMLGITAGDLAAVAVKDFRWEAIRDDGTPLPAELHPAAVALQTGMPVSGVILGIPNPNGSLTWLSVNSRPVFRDGEMQAVVTSYLDVTDRRTAEHRQTITEERWKLAVEGARDGIWDWDAATNQVFFSRRWKEILGYAENEIGNSRSEWEDRIHPEDKAATMEALAAHLEGKTPFYEVEYRMLCKDGSWKWILARGTVVTRDTDGKALRFVGAQNDITERKIAENARQQAEQQYRDIFEGALEGIYRMTMEGKALAANPALARILGYDSDREFLGTISDAANQLWVHPEERAKLVQLMHERPIVRGYECLLKRKDGTSVWVSLNGRKVCGPDGQTLWFEGFIEDITEKRRAADALSSSERRFRALAESALVGVYISHNRKITYANPAMAAIFGYTVEEMLGLDSLAIVQPCDHGLVTENMRRRLAGEVQSVHYEIHGRHKDGSTRYIEAYGTRVDMDGTPAFIGTLEDVTARKRNEQALRDSEAKFRATFMNGADALYIATLDEGRVVEVNDAFVKLFGYSRDEVIGKTPLQLNLFSNRTHWTRLLAELKANGHIIDFETVGRKKSGQEIAASMCCATFMLGGKWHIAGDIRDITERKQALDALRESEARLDEVARLAGIGFSIWDTQTDTTTGSAQLYRIFGWDPSQQPPKHSERSKIYTPESWARLSDAAKRAIARGEASELELDVVRPDGSIRHTRTYLGPAARDEHGHVVRLYGVIHDITDQKLAEQRLQQTLKSETIALLSRGIAHDFNNLIGAILAQVELLLIDASPGHPGGEELRRIEGLGRRASEIVRQLMIYAGQEQPCIAPVELSGLVKEILELLNISVSKNAVVRSELETNLPPVMADAAQLRQVIMNLVLNASEAIGNRPGEIGVTTSRFTVHKNYKEGIPGGDYLRLEISDTGCGMTEEVRARVFEPFYSTKGEGRGLGLATVHAIVRANRGFIDVASVPGQGSRFEILLPAAASLPHGEAATPAGMPAQAPISQTVLVVEDEESLRLAAVKFLGKRGFAVLQAADGSAAIGLLEAAKRIDVILLDVTIPGISSQEVITRSRALQPNAKIVLTTAYSREMVMGNFEGTPISGFIRKPYRLGEMVHLLQEIVSA